LTMKFGQPFFQGLAPGPGVADEVVVIGEDRPCLKPPARSFCQGEESGLEEIESIRPFEMMFFEVGRGRNDVCSLFAQSVERRVRPVPLSRYRARFRVDGRGTRS